MKEEYKAIFEKISTTNLSDALDAFGLPGASYGINGLYDSCRKIYGEAVTIKLVPADGTKPKVHLGISAITAAKAGDVIVIDNNGRLDLSCWGGVLATGAGLKGISGVVIDGACRDVDDLYALDFPVYARGKVVQTARGRCIEDSFNVPVQFAGNTVCPGDYVLADRSGVVTVAAADIDRVLQKALALYEKEEAMCADLRSGMSSLEVDQKYQYNKMV